MTKPDRIPCVVPYCNRTREAAEVSEWICGEHWRGVSRLKKATMRRLRKRIPLTQDPQRRVRLEHHADLLWDRMKSEAIEAAVGIA